MILIILILPMLSLAIIAITRKNLLLLLYLFPFFSSFLPIPKYLSEISTIFLSVFFVGWGIISLIQVKRKDADWMPYLLAISVAAIPGFFAFWLYLFIAFCN